VMVHVCRQDALYERAARREKVLPAGKAGQQVGAAPRQQRERERAVVVLLDCSTDVCLCVCVCVCACGGRDRRVACAGMRTAGVAGAAVRAQVRPWVCPAPTHARTRKPRDPTYRHTHTRAHTHTHTRTHTHAHPPPHLICRCSAARAASGC
jgi:hypothetical protein